MATHRIHLRGPWNAQWLSGSAPDAGAAKDTQRVKIPADWSTLFGPCGGRVRFTRRFQCPTNLEPHERVYIALDGVSQSGTVTINGTPVGSFQDARPGTRFDVTPLLEPTNQLQIDVECTPQPGQQGGIYRHVALEIDG